MDYQRGKCIFSSTFLSEEEDINNQFWKPWLMIGRGRNGSAGRSAFGGYGDDGF